MTEKVWLRAYEKGVPHEIAPLQYSSLDQYISQCCIEFQQQPAISNFGSTLSYAQFLNTGTAFAGYLQHRLGLSKGERIAIMLPNVLSYLVSLLGALKAGLVIVNINPLCASREVLDQLKDSGAVAMVVFENCTHVLEKILHQTAVRHVIVSKIGDLMSPPKALGMSLIARFINRNVPRWHISQSIAFSQTINTSDEFKPVTIHAEDLAFLQYTGGTTGTPKGAMLTHGNLLANIEQTYLWIRKHLREKQERIIIALPLYHIFALTINFLSMLKFGGLHILITDPRRISSLVAELKKNRFSIIGGVNTLFAKLLNDPGFGKLDFSNLRLAVGGGAAIEIGVAQQWQQLTGITISQAYGLTEASPGVCCYPLNIKTFDGSVGVPVPSTIVEIRDSNRKPLPIGEAGELWVKGPQVMSGYWQKPKETREVLTSDGWLRTGDIATIDNNGHIRILDRKKDIIIVSGFKVYPSEVENVLTSHPAIDEAAVIGAKDSSSGEAVHAFIVKNLSSLTATDVHRYCEECLSHYKIPKRIVFLAELPKSPVGKVLRRSLREME